MVKKPIHQKQGAIVRRGQDGGDALAERVVHELNNLIDGCMRNMSLAITQLRHADGSADGSTQDAIALERLETASIAIREMAALTRQWSKLATMAAEHRPALASEASVDLLPVVVAQAVRLLRPVAASVGVTLDADVATELADLPAGPVFPILLNAVRNSIDALATSQPSTRLVDAVGHVYIAARRDGGDLLLTVTDNGPGIAPKLLDVDGQFRFGRTTKLDGHGLGLMLCREMISDCGGTLELTNRPSGGAVLTCRCPVGRLRKRS